MEWDRIEKEHGAKWPDKKRTTDSLKRKFQNLYRHRIPTGDPNCPVSVRRAKRIRNTIREKTELSDGEEEDNLDEDSSDDDDDDDSVGNPGRPVESVTAVSAVTEDSGAASCTTPPASIVGTATSAIATLASAAARSTPAVTRNKKIQDKEEQAADRSSIVIQTPAQ